MKRPTLPKGCRDVLLALLVTPCARLLRFVRSQGLLNLPRCTRALDQAGLLPVREHYYEPYLKPDHLRRDLDTPRDLPGLELRVAAQLELLGSFTHQSELAAMPMQPAPLRYGYRNNTFGPVDAGLLYGMIRHLRPRRIVEVGCGMSTLVIRVALEAARQGNTTDTITCEHVCIEPYEHPWLDQLPVRVIRDPLERMDPCGLAASLDSGDLLFIDSSHVVKPQGDVLFMIQEVLPRLRPGVVVHFHDIFTPRDYPSSWLLGARVLWTEQYLLESFLCGNPDWDVLLAANLLAKDHHQALAEVLPLLRDYPQGLLPGLPPVFPNSFYIRKCEPPRGSDPALGHPLGHAMDHDAGTTNVAEPLAVLVRQLKTHEGLRLTPYRCTSGKLTIGYGRNLEDTGVSLEEADRMLHDDALQALSQVRRALPWTEKLDAARSGVLAAMGFNMGINALLGFKRMLFRLESGDYEGAAREMLDSRWRKQVGPRAHALAEQMRTGRWP
jgi:GH24 family phage-related lysozyme (muramidase)